MERIISIDSRGGHDGPGTGGNYGDWAVIYASRQGLAQCEISEAKRTFRPGKISEFSRSLAVRVIWNEEDFKAGDYILVHHRRSPNPFLGGSSSRESYELIAGTMPAWADFPAAWKQFVGEHKYTASDALAEIAMDEVHAAVEYAVRKSSKNLRAKAWAAVQEALRAAGLLKYEPKHSYSLTGVAAMPMKICRAVDWRKAGVSRPEFLNSWPAYQEMPKDIVMLASPDMDLSQCAESKK